MKIETINYQEIKLQDLEVKIEKYPMGESPHLLENFLIIGYEEIYLEQVIIKSIKLKDFEIKNNMPNNMGEKGSNSKINLKEFKCRNFPSILSSISSNFDGEIFDSKYIIEKVFPIPPNFYYSKEEIYKIDNINVVFTNIQNNNVNIGYGNIFYEHKKINDLIIYIPKAFVIISQYPFFKVFINLCKDIKKLYENNQLQIPIEIQIFNIVNFVPAPVNSHMNMVLFSNEDLFEINKCKTQKEFFNKNNEIYILGQLSGYRFPEINFIGIMACISPFMILEVYLELICGKTIAFFCKNIEKLNQVMFTFQQFFFPLSSNENISGLSPTKYFYSQNIEQNIVGFVCEYNQLENINPNRELKEGEFRFLSKEEEEEKKDLEPLLFKCDYILDLDKKELKHRVKYDNGKKIEENKENFNLRKYIEKIVWKRQYNSNSYLENSIAKLVEIISEISFKSTSYSINFFEINDGEELMNRKFLNAFYQFNLNIIFLYYLKISTFKEDYKMPKEDQDINIKPKENSDLNDDEYLFLSSFSHSLYCNSLKDFFGGLSYKIPIIYKTPKKIFECLISLKTISDKIEDTYFANILDIYDTIYNIKEKKCIYKKKSSNTILISFLNFYKYYFSSPNIASFFYNIVNSDFVKGTINKNNKLNIKYTYKYKKIDIDKNIIFQYIYLIKEMDELTKNKCFNLNGNIKQIEEVITNITISSSIEKYYFDLKFLDYKHLINFSILSLVALTASKHKLLHFTPQIYQIIGEIEFSIHKFIEIILSISLRIFSKEISQNLFIYEKYFNLYKEGIEKRKLFPNNELIILENKIDQFIKKIQNSRKEIMQEDYKNLIETKEKNRYTLNFDKKLAKELIMAYNFGNEIKAKITFKTKKKKIYLENCYSYKTLYDKITLILNQYYNDLDYSKIDKNEYNNIIINLIYLTTIHEKDFPKDINLFLFYCIEQDK